MPNYAEHSPSEMLHLYIDGEIDAIAEMLLFRHLADNQELRAEMRRLMQVRAAVSKDNSLAPPAALRDRILERAGMADADPERRRRRALPLWFARSGIATALLLTALGSSLLTWYLQPAPAGIAIERTGHETVPPQETVPAAAVRQLSMESAAALPVLVKTGVQSQVQDGTRPVPAVSDFQAQRRNRQQSALRPKIAPPGLATSSLLRPQRDREPRRADDSFLKAIAADPVPVRALLAGRPSKLISIGLRERISRNWPAVNVPSNRDTWMKHRSLSVLLGLGEGHALGLEFGQEPFAQIYHELRGDVLHRIEQQPTLSWLGLAYRYQHDGLPLLPQFDPYAEIMLGATDIGPLLMGRVGIAYAPGGSLSLSIDVEGGLLSYSSGQQTLTSRLLGLSYGISYRF